jgi:hypothetical protein
VRFLLRSAGTLVKWKDGRAFRNQYRPEECYRIEMTDSFREKHGSKYMGQGESPTAVKSFSRSSRIAGEIFRGLLK